MSKPFSGEALQLQYKHQQMFTNLHYLSALIKPSQDKYASKSFEWVKISVGISEINLIIFHILYDQHYICVCKIEPKKYHSVLTILFKNKTAGAS